MLSCNITESSQPFPKCQIFLTPLIGQNLTNLTSQTPGLLEYFSLFWKHSYIWTCIRSISCRVLIGSFKNVICKKPVFVPGVSAAEFSLAHLNQLQSSHWFISNVGCENRFLPQVYQLQSSHWPISSAPFLSTQFRQVRKWKLNKTYTNTELYVKFDFQHSAEYRENTKSLNDIQSRCKTS